MENGLVQLIKMEKKGEKVDDKQKSGQKKESNNK